ncbi:transposable element-related [Anaeramoeba flamelloides]|uniref:Transposable element-related n=1 Tax=Anaeramoeba flamelloides TaxID=1746091 RepID=A0ABQ8Y709_9EUKA|nr:transposable element-related [Anaeramoeba flamelloides]
MLENQVNTKQILRFKIIESYNQRYSTRQIAEYLNISQRQVVYWIQKWNNEGRLSSKKRGRKKKEKSEQLEQFITQKTIGNRNLSCKELSLLCKEQFQNECCSTTTVYRLRKQLKFDYKPPKIRQCLTELQKIKRESFAYDHQSNETNWKNVVFSDESWFYLNPTRKKIWRRRNENDDSVFDEKEKFSKKILIWGAFSHDIQTDLIIIKGNVNTEVYLEEIIKKSRVIELANEEYGSLHWIFQQDGARPHISKKTMKYLNRRCMVLDPWPPNSPDLNPIENLWSIMDKKLLKTLPTNEHNFIELLKNIWDNICWETLEKLSLSMKKRIELVIQREGESINGFY